MRIRQEKQFKEDFASLPAQIKARTKKQLALFLSDPRHPSLRIKKMQGFSDLWEGRITRSYRFTFQLVGDTCRLRRIGPHSILDSP